MLPSFSLELISVYESLEDFPGLVSFRLACWFGDRREWATLEVWPNNDGIFLINDRYDGTLDVQFISNETISTEELEANGIIF